MDEHNGAMMQYYHWYTPADGMLWTRLANEAPALAEAGFTSVWLPPAYKGAAGGLDSGYGVYDLFDLGEFDQKGSTRTKYGTRNEYLAAIRAAQNAGIRVYADIVFNHKMGGDHQETVTATPYDAENRRSAVGEPRTIRAWTHFAFPARAGRYSTLEWHWWHFNAVDAGSAEGDADTVYLFAGKRFADDVDLEKGNYDYLMGCNLDIADADVREELFYWGRWYLDTTGVDGVRFDAVKHVPAEFFRAWLDHVREHLGRDLFAVGEYWSDRGAALSHFIERTERQVSLFDTGLQFAFAHASRTGSGYDLRKMFDGSLVSTDPYAAVTIVANHDTQPLQALESVVEPWFKPLAYALILLRRGGYPCVFAADYYGAEYRDVGQDGSEHDVVIHSHKWMIDRFLEIRRRNAYGDQYDYFDDPNCVGWTRLGDEHHPGGLAVVLSNAGGGVKHMETGAPNTTYHDHTDHVETPVVTDEHGWGAFSCAPGSVSVWAPEGDR
ncbi:MAG: alpha-amylase [Trueperaceae bacterium]|nr:alpha-amylase [Trueperaceae bacterium]